MPPMTADDARYIARRRPTTPGEQELTGEALRCLARSERSVRGVENEIARKLTAEEVEIVRAAMA